MRIAWFRDTSPDITDPLDDTAALIGELRAAHDIDVITPHDAHDFVWQQHLRPWHLCVYELDHTRSHQFVLAYLLNYPGVLLLRSTALPHLRVPLLASRVTVTNSASGAELLQALYPEVNVRCGGPIGFAPDLPLARQSREAAEASRGSEDRSGPRSVKLAVFDQRTRDAGSVGRALQRARDAGAEFEVITPDADANRLARCDVVIAPGWPPFHHVPTAVLAGMAAAKAIVTIEMDATADWPAVDPQTWQPRGLGVTDAPIAVTIDPRDEEHSLMLAIRRLSSDASSREQLGMAAHAWWKAHATPAHAAATWTQILDEAVRLSPPARPDDWPPAFGADGTELARSILGEFGLLSGIGDQGSGIKNSVDP
jgi:hypothetical protein